MELTQQEKTDLEGLVSHRGFKVVEKIISGFELDILRQFKTISVADVEQLKILNANQNYLKGLEDTIQTIRGNAQSIKQRTES